MATEGNTPQGGIATQEAAPKSAAEMFSELETDPNWATASDEDDEDTAEPSQGDAEPEAEAEGDDPTADGDGEPDDDDTADNEPEEKLNATVEIDGKPVTLDELKSGYLRQQDYTRKTQALASDQKEFGQAVERVTQLDQSARQSLDLAANVLRSIIPPMPDLSTFDSDPVSYLKAKEAHQQAVSILQQLEGQKRSSEQRMTEEQKQQEAKAIQAEAARMVEAIPELATEQGRSKFRTEAIELGKHYGLTATEIDSIRSVKELAVLKDAIAYRKLQAAKPKAVEQVKKAPQIAKPGTREPKTAGRLDQLRRLGQPVRARDIFAEME